MGGSIISLTVADFLIKKYEHSGISSRKLLDERLLEWVQLLYYVSYSTPYNKHSRTRLCPFWDNEIRRPQLIQFLQIASFYPNNEVGLQPEIFLGPKAEIKCGKARSPSYGEPTESGLTKSLFAPVTWLFSSPMMDLKNGCKAFFFWTWSFRFISHLNFRTYARGCLSDHRRVGSFCSD